MAVRKPAAKAAVAAPKTVQAAPVAAAPEAVKVEAPKAAAPKAEAPKVEAPKAEAPKVEAAPVAKPAAKPAAKAVKSEAPALPHVDVAAIQDNLRKAATKSIEQGRVAYDRLKEASEEAAETLEASFSASSKGAAELAAKALEVVKTNANATFDHLKALASVKNLADAVSLHGQFIRAQSESAVAQAKEIAEIAKKTATETAAPIQAQLKKPLSPKS